MIGLFKNGQVFLVDKKWVSNGHFAVRLSHKDAEVTADLFQSFAGRYVSERKVEQRPSNGTFDVGARKLERFTPSRTILDGDALVLVDESGTARATVSMKYWDGLGLMEVWGDAPLLPLFNKPLEPDVIVMPMRLVGDGDPRDVIGVRLPKWAQG